MHLAKQIMNFYHLVLEQLMCVTNAYQPVNMFLLYILYSLLHLKPFHLHVVTTFHMLCYGTTGIEILPNGIPTLESLTFQHWNHSSLEVQTARGSQTSLSVELCCHTSLYLIIS